MEQKNKLKQMTMGQFWAMKHKLIDEKMKLDFKVDILSAKISAVNDELVRRWVKKVDWGKK